MDFSLHMILFIVLNDLFICYDILLLVAASFVRLCVWLCPWLLIIAHSVAFSIGPADNYDLYFIFCLACVFAIPSMPFIYVSAVWHVYVPYNLYGSEDTLFLHLIWIEVDAVWLSFFICIYSVLLNVTRITRKTSDNINTKQPYFRLKHFSACFFCSRNRLLFIWSFS